jgi:HK97 gp10 family phage protein
MAKLNYESRVEKAKQKIKEKPQNALREIGKFLAKEIRNDAARSTKTRIYTINGKQITVKPGRLKRSIGYWYRKKEGDLQVGSKAFYAKWLEFGSSKNTKKPFLMITVLRNVSVIQSMIADALKELDG